MRKSADRQFPLTGLGVFVLVITLAFVFGSCVLLSNIP